MTFTFHVSGAYVSAVAFGGAALWCASAFIAPAAQAGCIQTGVQVECADFDADGFRAAGPFNVTIRPDGFIRNVLSVDRVGNCPLSLPAIEIGAFSTVTNEGLVSTFGVCGFGIVVGRNSSVTNAGTILTHDLVAYGIIAGDGSSVRHRGILTTFMQGSSGVLGGAGMQVVTDVGSKITTGGSGSAGIEVGANSSIINAGSIVTTAGAALGIDAGANSVVVNSGSVETGGNNAFGIRIAGGTLTNSGRIRSVLAGPAFPLVPTMGVWITGAAAHFTNTANGSVEASHIGVRIDAAREASFVNDGRIEVRPALRSDGSMATGGAAVMIGGTTAINVTNTGSIVSIGGAPAIRSLGPQLYFTNRGAITGDVILGPGDDVIALHEGSVINGTLDAGAGVDTVTFHGSGVLADPVLNVEYLSKIGRGDLVLARNVTASQQVNVFGDGGIVLNAGARLTAAQTGNLGSLRGTGIIDGALDNSGLIAPGTAAAKGTLTITGAFRQFAGATLAVRLSPDGTSDRFVLGGPATFGGRLTVAYDLTPGAPGFQDGQRFEVVTPAFGTLTTAGQFTLDAPQLAFMKASLISTAAGGLVVELDRLPYGTAGITANQRAVGDALDRLRAAPPSALGSVFSQLDTASLTDATAVLAGLTPESPARIQALGLASLERFTDGLRHRAPAHVESGSFAWARGFTGSGRSRDAVDRADYDLSGIMGGIETRFGRARIGVAAGRTDGGVTHGAESADADASIVALTGHFDGGAFGVDTAVVYGSSSPRTHRSRTFNGVTETLRSDADADLWSFSAEGTFTKTRGSFALSPHAGLAYHRVTLSGLDEGRALGARIADAAMDSLRVRLGTGVRAVVGRVRPYGDVSISAELLDRRPHATAQFIGVPGATFDLFGDARRRIAVEAEAGMAMALSDSLEATIAGHMTANDMLAGRGVSAGLTYRW